MLNKPSLRASLPPSEGDEWNKNDEDISKFIDAEEAQEQEVVPIGKDTLRLTRGPIPEMRLI